MAVDTESGMGLEAQMQFSNDGITWSDPEAYAIAKTWTLASGEGEKTVCVRYKDAAGNWSQAYNDGITLDTQAPNLTLTPVTTPTNQDVSLSYTISDNYSLASEITLTGDSSPYTSEGTHKVTLTAQDLPRTPLPNQSALP